MPSSIQRVKTLDAAKHLGEINMNHTTNFEDHDANDPWKEAQAAGYWMIKSSKETVSDYDYAKMKELYFGYTIHYRYDPYIPVEAEAERTLPIPNSDYTAFGKLDTLVTLDGINELYQMEHKTGTRDADSDDVFPFVTSPVNSQITTYSLLQQANGEPINHTIVDYAKVPGLRPKAIPVGKKADEKGTLREIRGQGTYFGFPLSVEAKAHYRESGNTREIPECFGYRVREHISKSPNKYYYRKSPVIRTQLDHLEQLESLEQLTRDIDRAAEEEHLGSYYKNTTNCMSFNSKCDYFDLCAGTSTVDNGDWESRSGSSGTGSKFLSYSKATCFMSCRRKFKYRYVDKIQKRKGGAKQLRLGSLFHIGLEAYYEKLIEIQSGGSDGR